MLHGLLTAYIMNQITINTCIIHVLSAEHSTQKTQDNCIKIEQCWTNVGRVGATLYKFFVCAGYPIQNGDQL